jgi:proteic killer suppression protein
MAVIKSFRRNALQKFFQTGKAKGIPSDMATRLTIRLDFLNRAKILEDVNLPGWGLHSLKGQRLGEHSISVTGNYRLTFRFEKGDAHDVDLEDYH